VVEEEEQGRRRRGSIHTHTEENLYKQNAFSIV
jgi:hypothetical protein